MKMIRAIVRPEKEPEIAAALEEAGFISMTKSDVYGRGKQKGITVGNVHYDELAKTMFMLVVEDEDVATVVQTVGDAGRTGQVGDGKVFVTDVSEAYTVRTGESSL